MGTSIRNETTKESSEIQRSNKADRIPTVPPDGIVLKTGSKSGPWTGEKNVPPPPEKKNELKVDSSEKLDLKV